MATANKRAETVLQQWAAIGVDRDQFLALSLDMLCVSSGDGYFKWLNAAFSDTLGWTIDELLAQPYTAFVHPDDLDKTIREVERQVKAGEKVFQFENRYRHKDGSWRVLSWKSVPYGDLMYAVARDVTERDRLEQALRETNATLELRVAERTRALVQAQKMEAIGQLTGGMAHDFNNLLTVILANADTLEQMVKEEKFRHLATMIRVAAERGAELTNSLLAFARRQSLAPKVVNVNKLLVGMDKLLRRSLGEQIEIEFVQGDGLWQIMADPTQLESAILNLAINGRDAMQDGGRLTIETGNTSIDDSHGARNEDVAPGQYALVSVSDTGSGMSPETMARVFEPFFTTKEVGKGTGLGLAMVYGFVKQSGGHVRIHSQLGQGTTFKIYLPRSSADEASAAEVDAVQNTDSCGSETILMVEDDDLVREQSEMLLNALGYRVLVARDGPEALAVLQGSEHIDLLFTDVVMRGGMSGQELAVNAARLRPSLPVLFTSGYMQNSNVQHGRLPEGTHLLKKPYRRQDLALKLRELLVPY